MAEGDDTPRPRRAFTSAPSNDETQDPTPRRGVWPAADIPAEPEPVSRRSWWGPETEAGAEIQAVSGPARRVRITPAELPDASEADDATTLSPTGARPAGSPEHSPVDETPPIGRRGRAATPPPTAATASSVDRATPGDGTPAADDVTPDDKNTPAAADIGTASPAGAVPAAATHGTSQPGAAAGEEQKPTVSDSGESGAALDETAVRPRVPALDPQRVGPTPAATSTATPPAGAPGFTAAAGTAQGPRTPVPVPTLQPPSYGNQPLPAPQEPAPEPIGPLPAAQIAGPARPPKGKAKRGPARAKAGQLVEWDAPTDSRLDKRTRFSLSLAAVAALVVVAIAVGYAVITGRDSGVATEPTGSDTPTVTRPPEQFPAERMLLTEAGAKLVSDQAWKISLTQEGINDDSPRPSCIRLNIDGAPVPRATMLRTLTTSGDTGATALHLVDNYATAEEAAQVFASRATQLGSCDKEPTLITGGYTVSDIGNEALGVTTEVQDDKGIRHTILVTRTGTAVNVIDIAQPGKPVDMSGLVKAMAGVVDTQCTGAVGLCSLTPTISQSPPPSAGGDPGFLTSSDIPRITTGAGSWSANPATTDVNVIGSQCEGVSSWGAVKNADDARQATFLLMDDPASPTAFGLDEVLLTMNSDSAAESFVEEFNKSMGSCSDRMLTATVTKPVEVTGNGARGADVSGYVYKVTQKSGSGDVGFRIGVATSNSKVIYLVLPVDGKFDFSDEQWQAVVSRAGERASQMR